MATGEMAMALGDRLQQARKARGLTQQALAMATGLSVSVVHQVEYGRIADPRASTLYKLAKALGTTVEALMEDGGEAAAPEAKADAPPAKGKKGAGGKGDQAKTKGKRS
jgi:transcriptional regulator with XRE-family HTH domain